MNFVVELSDGSIIIEITELQNYRKNYRNANSERNIIITQEFSSFIFGNLADWHVN